MRAEVLPGPTDTSIDFAPGHALARRVPRENLWIVFRASDAYLDLLTIKDEPPIPSDS